MQVKKKDLKAKEKIDNALLKKTGLEISLVPEHEDDIKLASLLKMKPVKSEYVHGFLKIYQFQVCSCFKLSAVDALKL